MKDNLAKKQLEKLALESMEHVMSSVFIRSFMYCWSTLQRATRDSQNQDKARIETSYSTHVFADTIQNSKSHWEGSLNLSGENVEDKPNKIPRLNLIEERYARGKVGERRCNSEHGEKGNLCCRDGRQRRRIMKEILTKVQGYRCVTTFKSLADEDRFLESKLDQIESQKKRLENASVGIKNETVKPPMPNNTQINEEANQSWNEIMAQMRIMRNCIDNVLQMSSINKKNFQSAELGWKRIIDRIVLTPENEKIETIIPIQKKVETESNLRNAPQIRPHSSQPVKDIFPKQKTNMPIMFMEPPRQIAFAPQPISWQRQPDRRFQQSQPNSKVLIEVSPINQVYVPALEMKTFKPRLGKEIKFSLEMPHVDK